MLLVDPPSTKVRAKSRQAGHANRAEGLSELPARALLWAPQRTFTPDSHLALSLWAGAHRPAILLGAWLGWL